MYESSLVRPDTVRTCRQVCSTWKEGVDKFFQTTNFHCLAMKRKATNSSDFVLRMPMNLVDIAQIREMELHPRCVSFGRKLTLLMRQDQRNVDIFPDHLGEINVLLRTVHRFWELFQHLEVTQLDEVTVETLDHIRRRQHRRSNPDYVIVPFGDVGLDQNFREWVTRYHVIPHTDDFEMYIPFLHLMTNLKKITLRINRRWVNTRILLHIPKTVNLEEIYMEHVGDFFRGFWSQSCASMFQKCANSLRFLAGVNLTSLRICANWTDSKDGNGPVFEKLKELHLKFEYMWTYTSLESLSAFSIQTMFPVLTVLVISVDCGNINFDLWESMGNFVNKFPCVKYFSLSGCIMPDYCLNLSTLFSAKKVQDLSVNSSAAVVSSGLTTFRFNCPMHVPYGLMCKFPALKHVIVEEWPKRCRMRKSKSRNARYVRCFFKLFPNVSTLSFILLKTSRDPHDGSMDQQTITHFQSDQRKYQRRNMTK